MRVIVKLVNRGCNSVCNDILCEFSCAVSPNCTRVAALQVYYTVIKACTYASGRTKSPTFQTLFKSTTSFVR